MSSIKFFGYILIAALIGLTQAVPLLLRSEATETIVTAPVAAAETQDDSNNEWNTAAFANLDRQLRSEDLVPLSRRMREILNYASRMDESALDLDSGIRVSNGEPNDDEKAPLALIFVDPVPASSETTPSTTTSSSVEAAAASSNDESSLSTSDRLKRSFNYYPARG